MVEKKKKKKVPRVMIALIAVQEDAEIHGLKKGHGGLGEIVCPICKKGKLRYSVASYNGHIWGKCTTQGCVAWMM